jgi:hypothetical protein
MEQQVERDGHAVEVYSGMTGEAEHQVGQPQQPRPAARVTPGALRRLNRLHAQLEMAEAIYRQAEQAWRQSLFAACEDAGVPVMRGMDVDLDFNTGAVRLTPSQS